MEFFISVCTAISRPGGYEVYRLASNMLLSQKSRKPLQANFSSLHLSNQNEILKRGMTWTEQKPKGTTFKVQSITVANPWYIDLIHQMYVAYSLHWYKFTIRGTFMILWGLNNTFSEENKTWRREKSYKQMC
jgi:hypothetical protein